MSTSSIRVPGCHGSAQVVPSSSTDSVAVSVAIGPLLAALAARVSSNGFSARDRKRSARTRFAGTPSCPSAALTTVRYGPGPQTYGSHAAYGRARAAIAAAAGVPCSESSQGRPTNRPAAEAASPRSPPEKITECSSLFAYTSATRPRPAASTDLRMEMTGVIPLPAANSRNSPSSDSGQKARAGGTAWSAVPAVTVSMSQLEAYPPAVRLTVIAGRSPACGDEHKE